VIIPWEDLTGGIPEATVNPVDFTIDDVSLIE
jgi:hypothetical protein